MTQGPDPEPKFLAGGAGFLGARLRGAVAGAGIGSEAGAASATAGGGAGAVAGIGVAGGAKGCAKASNGGPDAAAAGFIFAIRLMETGGNSGASEITGGLERAPSAALAAASSK